MACGRISEKITVTIRYIIKNIAPHGHKLKSCINDTNTCGHGGDWRVIWVEKFVSIKVTESTGGMMVITK